MPLNDQEKEELRQVINDNSNELNQWSPEIGSETFGLLDRLDLPMESTRTLVSESSSILSKSLSPETPSGAETGLVIGYVQSGKTMSFTTLTAMARDNNFPLVIVIAGTSKLLFSQSTNRLRSDLRLDEREDRKWQLYPNPRDVSDGENIENTLNEWRDDSIGNDQKQTVLITVMKNWRHLERLVDLIASLDMRGIPTLIIDDEADQAGMNTLASRGDESTTYLRLLNLRSNIPSHTYIQYTATPQAPLLINIVDSLSPNFSIVLTPGDDYIGGQEFFENEENHLRPIPSNEIPTINSRLTEAPDSLLYSLKVFYLAVSAGLVQNNGIGTRSMMIHPSHRTALHDDYHGWIIGIRRSWDEVLSLPENDPDRQALLGEFEEAYDDLNNTVSNLPEFEPLRGSLLRAIRRTQISLVNASGGSTPEIDWSQSYSHILIGGQAMDRGFTVEGLTVTYMPRSVGGGNADTIQQRARFFGYKRSYLGFCRIFLEVNTESAFRNYVAHEENLREQLIEHTNGGRSLNDWRRAFFLDNNLQPTRSNVLDVDYIRGNFGNKWLIVKTPNFDQRMVEVNRQLVDHLINQYEWARDAGHPNRSDMQTHLVSTGISLNEIYENYLIQLRFTEPSDSVHLTGLLLQIKSFIDANPNAVCDVYRMSSGSSRRRGVDDDGQILNLMSGADPVNPPQRRGEIYPGDREIKSSSNLTIQIHTLTITRDGEVVSENVPTVAIWAPDSFSRSWVSQNQGGA